jgi:Tol biopolymer transport system component
MDADGNNHVQLTEMDGREFQPLWSPDGSQIAFLHTTNERADLYLMDADGGNLRQVTSTPEENEGMPAWSPDGSQFGITVFEDNVFTLFLVDAESGERTLFSEDAASAAWSPDGSKIAYGRASNGDYDLYVANADGSDATRLTDAAGFDAFPVWSPDGSELLFISVRDGAPQLYKMPATGEIGAEPAVNLIQNLSLIVLNPAYSPDGSQILYNARAEVQDVGGGDDTSTQDAGVTAILVQSALMAGVVILMARRWSLPFGAFTLILTVSTLFITVMSDLFVLVPGAIIAGLVADILARWLKPSGEDRNGLYLFAFLVPTIYYALYMLSVQLVFGVGWSIHVWTGAIFLAGMVGLLLSFLTLAANRGTVEQAV